MCLNLPDEKFDGLILPEALKDWAHLHPHYVAQRDRGYLFVAIALHGAAVPSDDPEKWVDAAVAAAGLGGIRSITEAATKEMSAQPEVLDGPFRQRLEQLLKTGTALFNLRGVMGDGYSVAKAVTEEKWLPPVILGDDHVVPFGQFKNDQAAVDRLFARIEDFWKIERKMKEFVEACGI